MKIRQDAWSEENDLLLAETVLRHVREGSTQLNAFEEVGDKLNRTSAACGFRWNAVVRHQYEKALQLAKKQRKQRQRILGKEQGGKKKLLYSPPVPTIDDFDLDPLTVSTNMEIGSMDMPVMNSSETETPRMDVTSSQEEEIVNNDLMQEKTMDSISIPTSTIQQSTYQRNSSGNIDLDIVLSYLNNLRNTPIQLDILKSENERLKRELATLKSRNKELEDKIHHLENNSEIMQEDYETLMKIMNRARKLVLLDEDERPTKFKMDRNGNLEKVAE